MSVGISCLTNVTVCIFGTLTEEMEDFHSRFKSVIDENIKEDIIFNCGRELRKMFVHSINLLIIFVALLWTMANSVGYWSTKKKCGI